ncbi:penicillin acylase family protein [Sphingomonas sp. 28-63-12]|uniref:penicillin acylase family protein n=1 Tax=Sphingomonas sp. 28-63-12 TaxID=1970434 RepID=UPI000BCCEE81|nr:MAG: hypothetical protein B7Y47_11140 [Sphingomonas sp. 28-63-12]
MPNASMRGVAGWTAIIVCSSSLAVAAPRSNADGAPPRLTNGKVTIIRDDYGMPHVYAAREADGFFGFGYALAHDRMRQTMLHWVMIRGDLAATFGRKVVTRANGFDDSFIGQVERSWASHFITDPIASDKLARAMAWLPAARANFARLSPQNRANLSAFVAGFRHYLIEHPAERPAWGLRPDQIEPALLMAWRAGEAQSARGCHGAETPAAATPSQSNLWSVWGRHTASGKTIHLSDPHWDPFTLGPSYYAVHLKAGALDYLNFTLPSQIYGEGFTPHAAWGATTSDDVNATCYAVTTEPDDPRAYRFDGTRRRMTVEHYEIPVRGETPIAYDVELTHHNGVRTPVMARQGNTAYAWSWAMAGRQGLSLDPERNLAVQRTLAGLKAGFAGNNWYAWDNYLVSTPDEGSFWLRPARQPLRDGTADPAAPSPGNSSATLWRGIHPLRDLPFVERPPQQYFSLSNIPPPSFWPDDDDRRWARYPRYFGFNVYQRNNTRQRRALELLAGSTGFTIDDAVKVALDTHLVGTDRWQPVFARLANDLPTDAPADLVKMLAALGEFNGDFNRDSRAALYFAEFRQMLALTHPADVDRIVIAIDHGEALSAPDTALLVECLASVRDNLVKVLGGIDHGYGALYRLGTPGHSLPANGAAFLAGFDLPDRFWADIGGLGFSSSEQTLMLNGFSPQPDADGRKYTLFAQTRLYVVDYGSGSSYSALAYGISEDPASRHGMDQFQLLSDRKLRPNWLSFEDLRHHIESTLVLNTDGRH